MDDIGRGKVVWVARQDRPFDARGGSIFIEYEGAGNTFALLDCRKEPFLGAFPPPHVDGLLVLLPSLVADVRMRIFNRDGSEAESCGNGLRCILQYLQDVGQTQTRYTIETLGGIVQGSVEKEGIGIYFPKTSLVVAHLDLGDVYFVEVGVPHLVVFLPHIDDLAIEEMGPFFRYHPRFAPRGVNVNFVAKIAPSLWRVRTYERGVEGETLSCGTGCASVGCVISHRGFGEKHTLQCRGGTLFVQIEPSRVALFGPAKRSCVLKD